MTRDSIAVLAVGLGLIGTCGWTLQQIDQNRHVGAPGLKMVAEPVYDEDGQTVNTNTVDLPATVAHYASTNAPITRAELGWLPDDTTYARRIYSATNRPSLQVNVVMMGRDRSSIHKPQICLTGQGWTIKSEGEDRIELSLPTVKQLPVWKMVAEREQPLSDGTTQTVRAVYVYWFVADNRITARHGERMYWSAVDLLMSGTLQRWAYVSVLGFCLPGGEEELYEEIQKFIVASVPEFHRFSDRTIVSQATSR